MTLADWQHLAKQLEDLPGGATAARRDYFAHLLADPAAASPGDGESTVWRLADGGALELRSLDADTTVTLIHRGTPGETEIARAGGGLLTVAAETAISPLLLLLLATASGQVDDGRRLKRCAPRLDGAARELLLVSVCRLCG